MLAPCKRSYDQPRQHIKKQRHYFDNKSPFSQNYSFTSSHVRVWVLDHKESWAPKNWCFWTVVLEKTFESPLDCKKLKQVYPKENQSWIFIGRTDTESEAPILWLPDSKNWLIGKDLILGKIEGRQRKGQQRVRWLDGITDLMDLSLNKLQSMGLAKIRHNWVTKLNWAEAAAAAAKLLQSCTTVRPHRRQPTRLLCPWDSPGKNTGVGCHFLLQCMYSC